MEHRALVTAVSRVLGRPLTDDEVLDIEARMSRHLKWVRERQPNLPDGEIVVEAARMAARDLAASARERKSRLEKRVFELQNSPNPLKWALRDRLALIAAVVLCGLVSTLAGFSLEKRFHNSLIDWLGNSASVPLWLIVGMAIGASSFYLAKFGRRPGQ